MQYNARNSLNLFETRTKRHNIELSIFALKAFLHVKRRKTTAHIK